MSCRKTLQCPRSGLEPGVLDLELSALTMRPPLVPFYLLTFNSKKSLILVPFAARSFAARSFV